MTAENRLHMEIEEYIVKTQGMRTMREELADLVCDGVIPMEEFLDGGSSVNTIWRRKRDARGVSRFS